MKNRQDITVKCVRMEIANELIMLASQHAEMHLRIINEFYIFFFF